MIWALLSYDDIHASTSGEDEGDPIAMEHGPETESEEVPPRDSETPKSTDAIKAKKNCKIKLNWETPMGRDKRTKLAMIFFSEYWKLLPHSMGDSPELSTSQSSWNSLASEL